MDPLLFLGPTFSLYYNAFFGCVQQAIEFPFYATELFTNYWEQLVTRRWKLEMSGEGIYKELATSTRKEKQV